MRLAVTSTNLSMDDLTLLVENEIVDRLASVDGVADVEQYGDQEKIFRVDVDQGALASRGLTVGDLTQALSNSALDVPAGSLKSTTQDIVVRATANLQTPEDFANVILQDNVRLGDVATVTLGPRDGETALRSNGKSGHRPRHHPPGAVEHARIFRAASRRLSTQLSKTLPEGTKIAITSDDAVFIAGRDP